MLPEHRGGSGPIGTTDGDPEVLAEGAAGYAIIHHYVMCCPSPSAHQPDSRRGGGG